MAGRCAAGGQGGGGGGGGVLLVVGCYKITQRDILTDGCVQNGGFLAVAHKSLELLIFTRAFLEKGGATSHYSGLLLLLLFDGCVVVVV